MEETLLTIGFLSFIGLLLYFVPRLCVPELKAPPLKRCPACHGLTVELTAIDQSFQVLRDGELKWYTVKGLRIPVCRACGAKSYTTDVDDQINAEIDRQRKEDGK